MLNPPPPTTEALEKSAKEAKRISDRLFEAINDPPSTAAEALSALMSVAAAVAQQAYEDPAVRAAAISTLLDHFVSIAMRTPNPRKEH